METRNLTCIGCPMGCQLKVEYNKDEKGIDLDSIKVSGNTCPRGEAYAISEVTNPTRTVTGTVGISNREGIVLSVKTDKPIPKEKIFDVSKKMFTIKGVAPIKIGDVVCNNICDTGSDLVATKNID